MEENNFNFHFFSFLKLHKKIKIFHPAQHPYPSYDCHPCNWLKKMHSKRNAFTECQWSNGGSRDGMSIRRDDKKIKFFHFPVFPATVLTSILRCMLWKKCKIFIIFLHVLPPQKRVDFSRKWANKRKKDLMVLRRTDEFWWWKEVISVFIAFLLSEMT